MADPPIIERVTKTKAPRRFTRQRFDTLLYVDLGFENGGFPIDISEDGMAFQGIRPLEKNQDLCVTLKLHGIDKSVTATGKIIWLTESRKGGALQFIDLTEASRHLINKWTSLQRQVGSPKESPTATISHVEAKGLPSASAIPLVANYGNSSAQSTTIVAAPLQSSSLLTGNAGQAITSNVTPKTKQDVKKSVSIQHFHGSADLQRISRTPTLLARDEQKHAWFSSYGLRLATSIAIVVICGAMLWPLRRVLLRRLVRYSPAYTNVQSASALTDALPPEQTAVVESSSDPTIIESSQLAPIANEQENLAISDPPNVTMSAPSSPVGSPTLVVPQINHGTTSKVPVFSTDDMRPRGPAIVPAQSEQSATVSPNSILEGTNELPGTGIAGEKVLSPEVKPPENPVSVAGSIEIISDPYPSIRVPAESNWRSGTSLKIGRLVSKVEPQYPQDALRQRIAGTAKVHVVIGRNGTVERAELVVGPNLLADAVLRAIQQWHYEPTILGGAAIEVEEDITVVFCLASAGTGEGVLPLR